MDSRKFVVVRHSDVLIPVCTKINSNTDSLYSQWSNSVIYWLINQRTDWAQTGVSSFGRQFDFHDVIYHISLVTLTIDDMTSLKQLMGVQNVRKNSRFSPNKGYGKF